MNGKRMISRLRQEFQPSRLLSSLIAGLVSGTVGVLFSISFAALIFSGNLERYLSSGVGIVLFSAVILRTVSALTSSFPIIIADLEPLPTAILAASVATIASSMPEAATSAEIFITVVCWLALTSLLTGAFLLALGKFKIGQLIRFIPYPVIGGCLAGAGWLLFSSSIDVMSDVPLSWVDIPALFQPDVLFRWLSGLIFAVVLLVISRRYSHWLIIPVSIVAAIGLFYILLLLTNTSIPEAIASGWLLSPFSEGSLWQPLNISELTLVNWSVIFAHIGNSITIMVISAIGILLTASSLELIAEYDIDMNRELLVAGIANLAVGLGGGVVGYHTLTDTVLAYRMGARSRLVGLITAGVFVAALIFGSSVIALFPKPVLGGLLLYLGLELLVEWVYEARSKFPLADYCIVLLILVVIGAVGFLQGVGVGLVVAVIFFVINYSRLSVAKRILSGSNHQSHVQRPLNQSRLLREKGDQIYILELQGLIFFGTANKLLNQIRQRISDRDQQPVRFVLLDFRQVSGLDSSAVRSFIKLKQVAQKQLFSLIFTHLSPMAIKQLQQDGALETEDPLCQVFPDLDRGLEWCESQILETTKWRRRRYLPLAMQLKNLFANTDQVSTFMSYLEEVQLPEGEYLFHQGDDPQSLYFVESGQVSTLIELNGGQTQRVQTLGAGTIVGEIAFYTKSPYETSAVGDRSSKLYRLGVSELQSMQQSDPKAAAAFSEFALSLFANRLTYANNKIANLLS